jgi:hypothetical protein
MQNKQGKDRRQRTSGAFPIYPLLIGLYPVLALTAFNITQIHLSMTYRSLAFSVVFSIGLYGILRLVLRDWARAAFLCCLLLILFFSFGQVYSLLKNPQNPALPLVRDRYLALVWVGLAGLSAWISTRKSIRFASVTNVLNVISLLLLVYPVYQVVEFNVKNQLIKPAPIETSSPSLSLQPHPAYPDIYYIVLDAYMRSDSIKAVYGYDNSAFLKALTARGFYIASCGMSNYPYTEPSLASSLNFNYLDKLGVTDNDAATSLVQSNAVRQFLKAHGYTIVAFETGFGFSEWTNADVYYNYKPNASGFNEFEGLFLQTTMARIILDFTKENQGASLTPAAIYHDRTIYNLNILKNIPDTVKGSKFVFAHFSIPHPPYVYGPNGKFVYQDFDDSILRNETDFNPPLNDTTDLTGYPNALIFIDKEMLTVVDQIIAKSKTPPVIIIQGDHGAFRYNTPAQRMSNLNAYYLPGVKAPLSPTITPVNTFRIIFNAYFGQNYPLLQNDSWYSPPDDRWNYTYVPNKCGQ